MLYPAELQLNKVNTSDTKASFLDVHLSILDRLVSSKIYDKRNDFDFDIVNFPFLDLLCCSLNHFLWCLHLSTYSLC